MKYYQGITKEDKPVNGGSYIGDTGDAIEKYNFYVRSNGMVFGFVESEIVLHHARCADVAKQRDASGSILQFGKGLDVKHTLQGAANPQTQTVVVGTMNPIKNLGGKVEVCHGTSRVRGCILKQMESGTHMKTSPFNRGTSTSIHAVAKIAERNSAIVVAIRDTQACRQI